jgi:hypothetical protein
LDKEKVLDKEKALLEFLVDIVLNINAKRQKEEQAL